MISKKEIQAFPLLPTTITQLAQQLHLSKPAAFKITTKLIENGLASKKRNGKQVIITKHHTTHAIELNEVITRFPRLPLEDILTYSNLTILSVLDFSLQLEDLRQLLNVTRQWIYKKINQLSHYGIILKEQQGYRINPLHENIHSFAAQYYHFKAHQHLTSIQADTSLIWTHGNEWLFTTTTQLPRYQTTAVTTFPTYHLPLITDNIYYYQTQRKLTVEDYILHTLLINPQSITYNSYALLLIAQQHPPDLLTKARLYNLTQHVHSLLSFLKTKKPTKRYLPTWKDYESLAQQYEV